MPSRTYPTTPDDALHFMREELKKLGYTNELADASQMVNALLQHHYQVLVMQYKHTDQVALRHYYDAMADVTEYVAKGLKSDQIKQEVPQ